MTPSTAPARYLLNERGIGTHQVIAGWVRQRSRVLDVGCADGYLMQLLRDTRGASCVGVEAASAPAATAALRGFDVVEGFAPAAFAQARRHGPFDHVVFADVLEHTVEPEEVLHAAARLLAPGGTVVVSVPNVAYVRARLRLLRGRWTYEDSGIFDRTHVRFFTCSTASELLQQAGLAVERTAFVGPLTYRLGLPGASLTAVRPQLLANQVVLEGRFRVGGDRPAGEPLHQ